MFAKLQPILGELRQVFDSPQAFAHLERLVMNMPDAQERLDKMRERFKLMARMRGEAASKREQV